MTDQANNEDYQALVIDDEPQVREFVANVLRGEGWNVSQSPSAVPSPLPVRSVLPRTSAPTRLPERKVGILKVIFSYH
jgi:CheY-like chemotaxis protein